MQYILILILWITTSLFTSRWYNEYVHIDTQLEVEEWISEREKIKEENKPQQIPRNFDLPTLDSFEDDIVTLIDAVKESVVSIVITKDFVVYDWWNPTALVEQQVWWWTWILVHKNWYILTNKHVVEDLDAGHAVIFSDWSAVEVTDVWLDPTLDIALLKIDPSWVQWRQVATALDFEDEVTIWQFALAIWNALAEFQNSVTLGIISGKNRKLTMDNDNLYAWLLQTDASISEGNSWWPLFNLDGQVVWINTAVSAYGENIWFAIPLTQQFIYATILEVEEFDAIRRPFVWVRYFDIDAEVAREFWLDVRHGIYIWEVVPWTPAETALLQAWDVITHIDWVPIDQERSFLYQLFTKTPGEEVVFSVLRGEDIVDLAVLLGVQ